MEGVCNYFGSLTDSITSLDIACCMSFLSYQWLSRKGAESISLLEGFKEITNPLCLIAS